MSNSHTHVEGETRETCRVCTPGTDRVELTEDERGLVASNIDPNFDFRRLYAAVESIVAARVQALTAERDEARTELHRWANATSLWDELQAARAELAAANTRCAELEGKCICNTGPGTDGPEETCPVHGRSYAEWVARGDALQATLDRVTASCTCGATNA